MARLIASLSLVLFMGLLPMPLAAERPPQITGLSQVDRNFMQEQRQRIDEIARSQLGRQLSGEKDIDMGILQDLVDRKLVSAEQTLELQAMGIVLGDLLARDLGMQWVIYEDRYGRSRALRLEQSDNFLFPVTMISRRVEADAVVSVSVIYEKARTMILPYKTPLPFQ
jgi:hypothetical protein